MSTVPAGKATTPEPAALCWICKKNVGNSGEHKTKRSDLLAVLGKPTQAQPLYYHDLERHNKAVGSLDAAILKSPKNICEHCNSTRTQPHDLAWELMSDRLRARQLRTGQWVRANRIFPYDTREKMKCVHLFFVKLFGCMLCESKDTGHDVPIDLDRFSKVIMSNGIHPEVHLEFGKCDGTIGRSNLHVFKTEHGSVFGGWLYELDTIAVSVLFAQEGRWEPKVERWHPRSATSSKRFHISDLGYGRRAAKDAAGPQRGNHQPVA